MLRIFSTTPVTPPVGAIVPTCGTRRNGGTYTPLTEYLLLVLVYIRPHMYASSLGTVILLLQKSPHSNL